MRASTTSLSASEKAIMWMDFWALLIFCSKRLLNVRSPGVRVGGQDPHFVVSDRGSGRSPRLRTGDGFAAGQTSSRRS